MKKGDKVIVLVGKDKKKSGTITKVLIKKNMVIVSGLNLKKRHKRAKRSDQKGSIVEMESPIHISNVKIEK